MARSVTRLGLPSRLNTNPNTVPSQEFIPGPSIAPAALSSAEVGQPSNPNLPQSLYVNGTTSNVSTPYGLIAVHFTAVNQNGIVRLSPSSITKNQIFTLPYSSVNGNTTITGKATYTYGISNGRIVPEQTANNGSILYQANSSLFSKAQGQYQAGKQGVVATKAELAQYQEALQQPNQSASYYQNYASAISNLMNGEYKGWNTLNYYQNEEQQGRAAMQKYAPVKIADITTSGVTPTGAQPTEYIYGNVSGKNQYLGALNLIPSISGSNVSFSAGSFSGTNVPVSGNGWYGNIMTAYKNGGVVINPKNYSSITTNAFSVTSNGATYSYMTAMPTGFGVHEQFGKNAFGGGLIEANNVTVPTSQGNVILGFRNGSWYRSGGLAEITTSYLGGGKLTQKVDVNAETGAVSLSSGSGKIGSVGNIPVYVSPEGLYSFAGGATTQTSSVSGITTTLTLNKNTGNLTSSVTGQYNGVVGSGALRALTALGFSKSELAGLPANTVVQVSPNANGQLTANFTPPGGIGESITYTSNSNNQITGSFITDQNGNFVSGSNFIKPLNVAGGNVNTATISGNTVTLPMAQYLPMANAQLASGIVSAENKNVQPIFQNPAFGYFMSAFVPGSAQLINKGVSKYGVSKWDPFYQSVQAGTLTSYGYGAQGTGEFLQAEATGFLYAVGLASAGTALEGEGVAALGAASLRVVAARALTGSTISVGLSEASSYANTGKLMTPTQTAEAAILGGATGVVLGGIGAPADETALGAVRFTAMKAITADLTWGGFNAAISGVVGLANPSLWTGTSSGSPGKPQSNPSQSQGTQLGKTQSSDNPYTIANLPSYLSFVGKSTLSGMAFGAEYGGAFYAVGEAVGGTVKAVSPGVFDFVKANPLITRVTMSGISGGTVAAYGVVTRQPLRNIVPEAVIAASIPLATGAADVITGKGVISDFKVLSVNEQDASSSGAILDLQVNGKDYGGGPVTEQTGTGRTVFSFSTGRWIFKTQYFGTAVSSTETAAEAGIGAQTGTTVTLFNSKGMALGSSFVPDQAAVSSQLNGESELIKGAQGLSHGTDLVNYKLKGEEASPQYIRFLSGAGNILNLRLNGDNLPAVKGGVTGRPPITDVMDVSFKANTYGEAEVSNVDINGQKAEMARGVAYNAKISGPIRFTALTYTPDTGAEEGNTYSSGGSAGTRAIGPRISAISGASSDILALSTQHVGVLESAIPGSVAYIAPGFIGTIGTSGSGNSVYSSGSAPWNSGYSNTPIDYGNGQVGIQRVVNPPGSPYGGTITKTVFEPGIKTGGYANTKEGNDVNTRTKDFTDTKIGTGLIPTDITGLDPIITGAFKTFGYIPTIGYNYFTSNINRPKEITGMPQTTLNATGQKLTSGLISAQASQTAQKVTQKTIQRSLPLSSFGMELFPPDIPDTNEGYIPHFKIKAQQPGIHGLLGGRSPRFSYVSDLMHASLGISGPRTKIGISRPVPVKRRRGRK